MGNAYTEHNALWPQKLIALTKRLRGADMARAAGGPGWTVAGLLGHLTFYDQRALVLLAKWKKALRLNRAAHREHHMAQIEKALAGG
jgi:hypothetical protein